MYVYFLIITILIAFGIGLFILKKEERKKTCKKARKKVVFQDKIQTEGEAQALHGMFFRFKCTGKDEKSITCYQKGSEITEKHNYGLFELNVKLRKISTFSTYELTHTHIVPLTVECATKSLSRIFIEESGYKINFLSGGTLYMVIVGAEKVELKNDRLKITVKNPVIIATKENEFPSKSDYVALRDASSPPFLIYTPNKSLNYFFNGWLWDKISRCDKKDFSSSVALACIKNSYQNSQIKEFIKTVLFLSERDMDFGVGLHLTCDYAESNGKDIFDERVSKISIRNVINRYIFKDRKEKSDKSELLLRLSAIARYTAFCDVDEKVKLLSKVEAERKKYKLSSQELLNTGENYPLSYFADKCALAKKLLNAKNAEDGIKMIQEYNVLESGKQCDYYTACIAYYYLVRKVFGISYSVGGYKFSPCFRGMWDRASVSVQKDGGRVMVELIPSEFDGVSSGGVKYSGDVIGKVGKLSKKYEVYFKE